MSEKIKVTCPHCEKAMNVPAAMAGKKVRCKGCKKPVSVEAKKATAATQPKADDDEWGPAEEYGLTFTDLAVRCPFCALVLEPQDAVVCLHCGYNLRTRVRMESKMLHGITFGEYAIWHAPGIACALVALAFLGIIACIWAKIGTPAWLEEWPSIKIYASVFSAFIAWGTGFFGVKRIILNPHPPDQVKSSEGEED